MGSWFRHAVNPESMDAADGSASASLSDDGAAGLALPTSRGGSLAPEDSGVPTDGDSDRSVGRPSEIVQLIDSIHLHLAEQGRSMEGLRTTVDRVAESLSALGSASERQVDLLAGMGPRIEAGATAAKKSEESLSELPRIADAQRETMVSVARQLDLLHGSAEQSVGALTEFRGSVAHLGEAGDASLAALRELHADLRDRETRFVEEYRRLAAKLVLIGWSFVGVAVVAMILALIGLFR